MSDPMFLGKISLSSAEFPHSVVSVEVPIYDDLKAGFDLRYASVFQREHNVETTPIR